MLLFMIKKTFFDWWDNFFIIFLMNIGYILILALIFSIPIPFPDSLLVSFIFFFLKSEIFFVYSGAIARATKDISDYNAVDWATFFQHLKNTYKKSLMFGALLAYLLFTLSLLLPFYQQATSFWQLMLLWFYFWIVIGILFTVQWFFPLEAQLEATFVKTLKKCLLFFLDNNAFSIGLWMGTLLLLVLSIGTGFLIPGITAVMLWWNVAVKLRLYKYDYLESVSNADRKAIPWEELLLKDQEIVGKRTLRGFFFPWKD